MHEMTSLCDNTDSPNGTTQSRSLFKRYRSLGRLVTSLRPEEGREYRKEVFTQPGRNKVPERQLSPVVDIPRGSSVSKETYLVPSSCKSICKNYNDLHIAGDQVMPIGSKSTDFTYDSSFDFCDGPFLQSSEIPPPLESLKSSKEFLSRPTGPDSSLWRGGSIRYKSIIQGLQPLSNSMLNDYLEQKVLELYKQYLMDSMVNSASPTKIMASELIMNNLDQITLQISKEQNMETTKAKDMVISCLLRVASGKQSTELSTPNLQISSDSHINV
ncbi:TLR adapter interacting with SLC15A4 on the lysosome [Latimeria chalumnae]